MRFLFYSHDGMGLGHVRRHLAIASALTSLSPSAQVLLATSVDEVSSLGLPSNVETLKLPGIRKISNEKYASRRLSLGDSEVRALRSALLQTAVRSFRPDVVLVDKHPLGACREFEAALQAARRSGARLVLGLRDILDDPETVRREWESEHLEEVIAYYYNLVLVYGVPSVFDTVSEYRFGREMVERTVYCGYVVNAPTCNWNCQKVCDWLTGPSRTIVLGTAGGGEDGIATLKTFIKAASRASWTGVAIAGPLMQEQDFADLQQFAIHNGVRCHRFISCLSNFFWVMDGLVCMGGYNTLVEAVSSGIPTVCVPRVSPRTEQLLRSKAFESLGLLRTLHPAELTPERLATEISLALETPRHSLLERASNALHLGGSQCAASLLLEPNSIARNRNFGPLPTLVNAAGSP